MATVKILYDNLGLSATWTASTDTATLPAANLGVANRRRPCRTTAAAAQWFKADLGSAKVVGALAIVSPNISQAAVVNIQGNAADAWGAPTFQLALAPWDYSKTKVLIAWFAAAQTFRWWRVTVDDPANADGYLQVGVVALGPVVSFGTAPYQFQFSRVDPSAVDYAPSGTPYALVLDPYAVVSVSLRHEQETFLFGDLHTALGTMKKRDGIVSVYGEDPGGSDPKRALNLYCRLTNVAQFVYSADQHVSGRQGVDLLSFRESN